ncbi:hypothetical protein [Candidatus Mycobacterium methanotrophicum]|uniref:Uncharacterized protein n=1 Tax=Candidatus Mycobacterium methanotrophicum TaxID=2943498 RepID=A0ABY4QHX4_9MYCO|nr:hypothetical protein [Candidatus Mycobacterium methanotrophicum]UQX10151.1 hypothetical protein M5I08_18455 [Candidatus Mycobacterium methanotrophicum]
MDETLLVTERGQLLEFSYTDMLCYAGPYSPAGVANAFKVMQRAFAALSPNQPPQRRSVVIRTAFQGPGARDGFEAVTRAVTNGRYTVDPALARPDRGRLLGDFVFQISIAGRVATLLLRPGFVTAEFIDLVGNSDRSQAEEAHLDQLKAQLAQQILAAPAEDVYELAD